MGIIIVLLVELVKPPAALGLREVTGAVPDSLAYYYLRQGRKVSFPGGEQAVQEGEERVAGPAQQLGEACFLASGRGVVWYV